jgi:hypothetical protein
VETHDLLHPDQLGGRPQRSAIDAAMALTHDVEMGHSKRLTMTAFFLDMRGAFDNVSSTRLTSTMRQLGCPMPVVSWCRSFLTGQSMALSFDGGTNIQRPVATGVPQGSPASLILFLLYCHGVDQRLVPSMLMHIRCMYVAYVRLYSYVCLCLCMFATCLCTSVCAYGFLCLLMPLMYAYVYLSICLWVMTSVKEFSVGL